MKNKKIEKILEDWRRWVYLGAGVICLILGFILAMAWSGQRENLLLTMGVLVLLPGGALLIYWSFKKIEREVVIVGAEKPTEKVNSLNIYAARDEETGKIYPVKAAFEWGDKPMGQPQQCLNNNKWYYIHIWNIEKGILMPFILPDSQYFDPREFANVITMPAHRKLFERRASLLQKVAPWIMVVAFIVSIFGMIVTAPTGV